MNDRYPAQVETENTKPARSLVERLDPSIGEATTVMGAMLTELVRRTLRGGVTKIDEELEGYVAEKVDATIAERRPVLEQVATEVAEHTARTAATEIAHEEVQALERRTRDADEELAGKIQEAEKQVGLTARDLAAQIAETEKRVSAAAQSGMEQQVESILERSRKNTALLMEHLKAVQAAAASLEKKLQDEQAARKSEVEQEKRARRATEEALRQELNAALQATDALAARIAELEKPRGLRGLLKRLFGRKKKAASTNGA